VQESPLLVVDDLFADRLTPAFGEALGSLLRERLDQGLPTILTSNHPPNWQSFFEADVGRLQSRWQGYGRELVLNGPDLRGRA
jgi:DNA replication protein DnaC